MKWKWLSLLAMLLPFTAFAESRPGVEIAASDSEPKVVDLAIGTDVVDRQPQGVSDTFSADVGKLYCWSAVKNSGEPTRVTQVWRHDGTEVARHAISVGKSIRWRSWTWQRIPKSRTGTWQCEIQNDAGERLGLATVTVK